MTASLIPMMNPHATCGRNKARSGTAGAVPMHYGGDQARGGRWGSSGMNSVASSDTRGVTALGASGGVGAAVSGTPVNTWWQQLWPLPKLMSCAGVLLSGA